MNFKNCPSFRLRSDFAVEMGVIEAFCEPFTEEQFRRYCIEKHLTFSSEAMRETNKRRIAYPNPTYVHFGGIIRPDTLDAVAYVSDGRSHFFPAPCALFDSVIERARKSVGVDRGKVPFAFPLPRRTPEPLFVIPEFAIFHDTIAKTACVAPYSVCCKMAYEMNSPHR